MQEGRGEGCLESHKTCNWHTSKKGTSFDSFWTSFWSQFKNLIILLNRRCSFSQSLSGIDVYFHTTTKNCYRLGRADVCFHPKGSFGWHQHVSLSVSLWDLVGGVATLFFFFFDFPPTLFQQAHWRCTRLVTSLCLTASDSFQSFLFIVIFTVLLQYWGWIFSSITQQYLWRTALAET